MTSLAACAFTGPRHAAFRLSTTQIEVALIGAGLAVFGTAAFGIVVHACGLACRWL